MNNIIIPSTAEEVDYDNIGEGENFLLEPRNMDFRIVEPLIYGNNISFSQYRGLLPGRDVMNALKDKDLDNFKIVLPLRKIGGIIVQEPQSEVYLSLGNWNGWGYREDGENSIITKERPLDSISQESMIAICHFSHYPIAIRCSESTTKFYSVSPEEMEQVLNNLKYLKEFLILLNAQAVNLTKTAYNDKALEKVKTGDVLAKTFYKTRGSN